MIEIKQISPKDLSDEDLALLELGCSGSYDKATAKDQLKAALGGFAWIFKFTGSANGLFVLARGNVAEREIVMTAVAGKGLIRNFSEVYTEVKKLVKSVGAKRLIGYVSRPGLAATYRRKTRALPVATLFSEEL
jgi:hypothetical protein